MVLLTGVVCACQQINTGGDWNSIQWNKKFGWPSNCSALVFAGGVAVFAGAAKWHALQCV